MSVVDIDSMIDSAIIEMVRKDGLLIRLVPRHRQTRGICLAAITDNPWAFEFVHDQTLEMCDQVLRRDPFTIAIIRNPTHEQCMYCARRNHLTIDHMTLHQQQQCRDELDAIAAEIILV
jgi:hypothetical protein